MEVGGGWPRDFDAGPARDETKRTDRLQKRQLYQEEGVPEYWIVDPELRRVERWRPRDPNPEVLTERLTWRPTPDRPALEIDLPELFRRVNR